MSKSSFVWGGSLIALGCLGFSRIASADPILTAVSQSGYAASSADSRVYVYGTFGRPGHQHRGWLAVSKEHVAVSGGTSLNGSSGTQTATGTYFKPALSGAALSSESFSDTDTLATLKVHLEAAATLTTPSLSHQWVFSQAESHDVLAFSLANDSSVSLDAYGSPGSTVQIVVQQTGEVVFTAHGSGGFHDALSAGDYVVIGTVTDGASRDTQSNHSSNLGSTKNSVDYTLSVSPQQ